MLLTFLLVFCHLCGPPHTNVCIRPALFFAAHVRFTWVLVGQDFNKVVKWLAFGDSQVWVKTPALLFSTSCPWASHSHVHAGASVFPPVNWGSNSSQLIKNDRSLTFVTGLEGLINLMGIRHLTPGLAHSWCWVVERTTEGTGKGE